MNLRRLIELGFPANMQSGFEIYCPSCREWVDHRDWRERRSGWERKYIFCGCGYAVRKTEIDDVLVRDRKPARVHRGGVG